MAKRIVMMLLDIEFPDNMPDDEGPSPPEVPDYATVENELNKLMRDGGINEGVTVVNKTGEIFVRSSWPNIIYEVIG